MRGKNKIHYSGLARKRLRLRIGDKVAVIAGEAKGKGPLEISKVLPAQGRIVVRTVNMRKKTLKKTQENPKGGIREEEFPIDCSNVLLYSDKLKRGVRVKFEEKDGKRIRVGIPCGTVFD